MVNEYGGRTIAYLGLLELLNWCIDVEWTVKKDLELQRVVWLVYLPQGVSCQMDRGFNLVSECFVYITSSINWFWYLTCCYGFIRGAHHTSLGPNSPPQSNTPGTPPSYKLPPLLGSYEGRDDFPLRKTGEWMHCVCGCMSALLWGRCVCVCAFSVSPFLVWVRMSHRSSVGEDWWAIATHSLT